LPIRKNVLTFTVRQIVRDGHAILRVAHDIDDGAWQFFEWGTPDENDAMVVSLQEMTRIDPSLLELADLPLGWRAFRKSPADTWIREPNSRNAH